ncbi:unnamed protein product [marine sediment metagenome]|uniref:Uncharacterized protein n=1 Tax=marine sediment metagenome TaxID=412755 RepID=X1SGU0_9ZZZZ
MVEERREPKPRGGAAKEIRTGHFIREWLEKVGDDSITGMHGALKSKIGRRNLLRPKAKWLRAPTYESFVKYFGHLRRWGLVEFVREEPTEWVPHEKLISIRMVGPWPDARPLPPVNVVPSMRRVYRLSDLGKQPEMDFLWDDPLARGLLREMMVGSMQAPP